MNEFEFYFGGWAEDNFFYIPQLVSWGYFEDPGADGSQHEGQFYPKRDATRDWLLPLDENLGHIRETSNPPELKVLPMDFDIEPRFIQHGRKLWVIEEIEDN